MPGRTLATWYGSGSDPTESTYQPLEPSFYSRPSLQPGSSQYEQQHQYGYYPINQGNPGSGNTYPDQQQQRTFSPNYPQQQQQPPPHYTPHSPASPVASGSSYHYNNRLSSPSAGQVSATPHHGMSYSNPQQQALYSSALSPGHYGSPNHGQHSGYSPSSSNSSGGGGNNQQWQTQQSAGDYPQHHSSPSPQHSSVLTGSPSASSATTPSPSPAHTPTSTGSLHSPPPPLAMSGQYPAHHHGRHPPMGSPPQPSQGHNLSSWGHHGGGPGQGMSMHPGAAMSGPPPQGPGYYPPPHPSLVGPGRGLQGPPQHAHMASSVPVAGDRRSPLHSSSPSSWNSLGSVTPAGTKASGSHEGSGRGPPPPSSHPQQNNSGSSGAGVGGNPLFSLQMLVNQDINRSAAAASAVVAQGNAYRASTPSSTHQQETVDLSSAGSGSESFSRMPPQQSGPIPLTRTDKQTPQVSEHLALRNGSIITSTSAASSVVSNTNVTSPPTPLNGEVSSDSGIGSSAAPTPSSLPETPSSSAAAPNTDINKSKTVAPVIDAKTVTKETVSVIAQTPLREKSKVSSHIPATSSPQQSSEGKPENAAEECELEDAKEDSVETDKGSSAQEKEKLVKSASEESTERCNPVIMSSTTDVPMTSREATSNIVSSSNTCNSASKQTDDGLSVPTPSPGSKDSTSPVRSPKSGNLKRTKKVDSILENLVESGTKKLGGGTGSVGSLVVEQPPQTPSTTSVVVAPASVIVSPVATSEDSSSGLGREVRTPSPGAQQKQQVANHHKSPVTVREEDAVSPTSGGGDDSENGKPRRKRKLDKPIRVSKISGEGEGEKEASVEGDVLGKDENLKSEEGQTTDESSETKETAAVECPTSTTNVDQLTKPIEAVTVDVVGNQDSTEKQEPSRRRRSSESSAPSPTLSTWPAGSQRTRRKSASDQQEDNGSSNGGDLLSVLVSDQSDKISLGESKPEVKNAFIEVETELEKMFAGIVETEECVDPLKLDTASPIPMEVSPTTKALDSLTNIDSTSTEQKPPSALKSRGRPKGSRNGARRSSESIFGPSSTDSTPKKKKKKQGKRLADESPSSSQKKAKRTKLFLGENGNDSPLPRKKGLIKGEASCREGALQSMSLYDSSSNTSSSRSRGPMIHIEGPKDNPYHVSVINAPSRGEDEEGGERGGNKKQTGTAGRRKNTSYHNDLDYRGKVTSSGSSASGMFSSTLSARYDAHTTDRTWICVFCKNGPHSSVGGGGTSGDLFGPYLLTPPDKLDVNGDGSADERDITEEQKRSGGKNKRSIRGAHMVEQFCQMMSRKVRRSNSLENAPVLGMVPVSSSGTDGKEEGCYEVWVHEECAVWAAGVYVVGSRIVGLREAVWSAVHTICNKCGEGGANVGCVRRGCEWRLHYGCAREQGWDLDEESYIARCAQHKKGVFSSEEAILPT
ncbi:uncharacterized protein CG5098-like isoform X2 [Periplaneta americana]|uniref:uncharacterized protein CG5098-like isoform X2 n=1 Tax=Periplaneta americana TaxID=6978 RepID=UPI0037E76AB9